MKHSDAFHIANGLGDSVDAPSIEQMRTFLSEVDETDREHGAAWLATESGACLEWDGDGRLVLTTESTPQPRHLRGVTREQTLTLWASLAGGDLATVEKRDWQPGNGHVRTAQDDEALRAHQHSEARAFYDLLGPERDDVPCRESGCTRGAVTLSVHCRVHHFEAVRKRPCPFKD